MRKPKLSKIGVPVWAGSMVVVAPIVEKLDDARIAVKRKGRHLASEYRLNKVAAHEELEERRNRKAMEEIQPHIDAVEHRASGVGVSPAHLHDMEEYQQDLRDEFAGYAEASFDQDVKAASHK